MRDEDLVGSIARILDETGLPPEVLSLEITEGLMPENEEGVLEKLRALRSLGLGVEIDDFGTGYSSLSYLRRLPVGVLKIDRSFVEDLTENPEARKVVGGIVNLARALNLLTVAEGIETEGQLETLKSLGCKLGQGYLFSRPVPANDVPPLLSSGPEPTTGPSQALISDAPERGFDRRTLQLPGGEMGAYPPVALVARLHYLLGLRRGQPREGGLDGTGDGGRRGFGLVVGATQGFEEDLVDDPVGE